MKINFSSKVHQATMINENYLPCDEQTFQSCKCVTKNEKEEDEAADDKSCQHTSLPQTSLPKADCNYPRHC